MKKFCPENITGAYIAIFMCGGTQVVIAMVETITEDEYNAKLDELVTIAEAEAEEAPIEDYYDHAHEMLQWDDWFVNRHGVAFYASIIEHSDAPEYDISHRVVDDDMRKTVAKFAYTKMHRDLISKLGE